MKYLKILFVFFCLPVIGEAQTQTKWGPFTVNQIVDKSDLVFEGRTLTDSSFFQNYPGEVFTVHRVLILKQFKGNFTSDTIVVKTYGGKIVRNGEGIGTPGAYTFKGDEALFLVTNSQKVAYGGNDPNAFEPFYGPGVSYITICDKKDVVKEVYEPIEAATGQKYVDVHPNTCATQQK